MVYFILKEIMSHITKIRTHLNNADKVERALNFLKLPFKKNAKINSWKEVPISEFVIKSPNSWEVGLQKNA